MKFTPKISIPDSQVAPQASSASSASPTAVRSAGAAGGVPSFVTGWDAVLALQPVHGYTKKMLETSRDFCNKKDRATGYRSINPAAPPYIDKKFPTKNYHMKGKSGPANVPWSAFVPLDQRYSKLTLKQAADSTKEAKECVPKHACAVPVFFTSATLKKNIQDGGVQVSGGKEKATIIWTKQDPGCAPETFKLKAVLTKPEDFPPYVTHLPDYKKGEAVYKLFHEDGTEFEVAGKDMAGIPPSTCKKGESDPWPMVADIDMTVYATRYKDHGPQDITRDVRRESIRRGSLPGVPTIAKPAPKRFLEPLYQVDDHTKSLSGKASSERGDSSDEAKKPVLSPRLVIRRQSTAAPIAALSFGGPTPSSAAEPQDAASQLPARRPRSGAPAEDTSFGPSLDAPPPQVMFNTVQYTPRDSSAASMGPIRSGPPAAPDAPPPQVTFTPVQYTEGDSPASPTRPIGPTQPVASEMDPDKGVISQRLGKELADFNKEFERAEGNEVAHHGVHLNHPEPSIGDTNGSIFFIPGPTNKPDDFTIAFAGDAAGMKRGMQMMKDAGFPYSIGYGASEVGLDVHASSFDAARVALLPAGGSRQGSGSQPRKRSRAELEEGDPKDFLARGLERRQSEIKRQASTQNMRRWSEDVPVPGMGRTVAAAALPDVPTTEAVPHADFRLARELSAQRGFFHGLGGQFVSEQTAQGEEAYSSEVNLEESSGDADESENE